MAKPSKISTNATLFTLKNFLIFLLVLRFVCGIFYALTPVHGLHIWRQTDVLSVSYSYYLRFFVEHNFTHFLLPSVLNTDHGEFSIVSMECPILNLVISWVFAFGPYWGKVIANLMILIINYALIITNYRLLKNVKIYGISAALAILLLANFSFTATWTTRVMPDVVSMLLTLTAVSLSWKTTRTKLSCIFAICGLLIKPTSIIVLLLLLCKEDTYSKSIKNGKKDIIWVGVSIFVALVYYFGVTSYLTSLQTHAHFNMSMHNPLDQLSSWLFSDSSMALGYLFGVRFICPPFFKIMIPGIMYIQMVIAYFGIIIMALAVIIHYITNKEIIAIRAWVILLLQILIIALLDGEHSFVHFYYYVGTTFIFALIFIGYIQKIKAWYKPLLIVILVFQMTDLVSFEIGDYFTHHFSWTSQSRVAFYDECSMLKANHPDFPWNSGYIFNGPITDNQQSAALGICFGEREKLSGASYGFYYLWDTIPSFCKVIDSSTHINLVKCSSTS